MWVYVCVLGDMFPFSNLDVVTSLSFMIPAGKRWHIRIKIILEGFIYRGTILKRCEYVREPKG